MGREDFFGGFERVIGREDFVSGFEGVIGLGSRNRVEEFDAEPAGIEHLADALVEDGQDVARREGRVGPELAGAVGLDEFDDGRLQVARSVEFVAEVPHCCCCWVW